MSTYDAYNLSLRDSTEFTVPTGGSGNNSNGRFSIFNVKIKCVPYSDFPGIDYYDGTMLNVVYPEGLGENIPGMASFEQTLVAADNEYHDYSFVALDGIAYFICETYISVNNIIGPAELLTNDDKHYVKITGNCQFDCAYDDDDDDDDK